MSRRTVDRKQWRLLIVIYKIIRVGQLLFLNRFYLYTSKYILSSFCKQGFKFKTHLLQQEPDGFQEVRQMFVYVGSCLICTIYQKMAKLWALGVFIVTSYCKYYYRHSQPCYPRMSCQHANTPSKARNLFFLLTSNCTWSKRVSKCFDAFNSFSESKEQMLSYTSLLWPSTLVITTLHAV